MYADTYADTEVGGLDLMDHMLIRPSITWTDFIDQMIF